MSLNVLFRAMCIIERWQVECCSSGWLINVHIQLLVWKVYFLYIYVASVVAVSIILMIIQVSLFSHHHHFCFPRSFMQLCTDFAAGCPCSLNLDALCISCSICFLLDEEFSYIHNCPSEFRSLSKRFLLFLFVAQLHGYCWVCVSVFHLITYDMPQCHCYCHRKSLNVDYLMVQCLCLSQRLCPTLPQSLVAAMK